MIFHFVSLSTSTHHLVTRPPSQYSYHIKQRLPQYTTHRDSILEPLSAFYLSPTIALTNLDCMSKVYVAAGILAVSLKISKFWYRSCIRWITHSVTKQLLTAKNRNKSEATNQINYSPKHKFRCGEFGKLTTFIYVCTSPIHFTAQQARIYIVAPRE